MATSSLHYEVIVAGAGGMGSAAAFHLARRGQRVLALDAFTPPHEMGSSHGLTRMIRLAYYEDPAYVPLLRRAYELWRELEALSGEELLLITGLMQVGVPGSKTVAGALLSCREHGLPHELLTAPEVMARYPAFQIPLDYEGLWQPDGGFVASERCIATHLRLAQGHGAELHTNERVLSWEPEANGVRVRTDRAAYWTERLVITSGAWLPKVAPEFAVVAQPERNVIAWFRPHRPELFELGRFPCFFVETGAGTFYGFPMYGLPGLKVGLHHHFEEIVDPDTVDRTPRPQDEAVLRNFIASFFPQGAGETLQVTTCLYTNSPDRHFIIDNYPGCSNVIVAGGFSGHGYKFCSVVGEIVADLAMDGSTRHPIGLFNADRFAQATGA